MAQVLRQERLFDYVAAHPLLDALNRELLERLRDNPRLTMAELARQVGMSSPAVTERVRRMEDAGIIQGYRLDIAAEALGLPLSAFVRVRPNPGQLANVTELARRIPEVVECHRITGDDCLILRVHFPSMAQLDRLLDRFLLYGTTTTSIVQSTPIPPRQPPIQPHD